MSLLTWLGVGTYTVMGKPPRPPKPPINTYTDIAKIENMAFTALVNKEYKKASKLFNQAYRLNPKYHNLYEINRLLQKNVHRMNEPIIRNMVLRRITKDLSWGATKKDIDALRRQIKN